MNTKNSVYILCISLIVYEDICKAIKTKFHEVKMFLKLFKNLKSLFLFEDTKRCIGEFHKADPMSTRLGFEKVHHSSK